MRFQISHTLHCPCRRCHTLHCPCRLCPCRRAGVATLVFFTVRAGVHALPHLLAVIQQGLLPVICVFLVLLKGCLQLVVIARDFPVLRTLLRCPNVAEFCFGLAKGLHHRFRSLSRHGANPMHAWHKTNRRLGQTCMDSPHIGGSSTLMEYLSWNLTLLLYILPRGHFFCSIFLRHILIYALRMQRCKVMNFALV